MSQLLQLRAAVIAAIEAALPDFGVQGHLGRFTPEDLTRFLTVAPAVRVALLAVSDARASAEGDVECTARLGVYVATRDQGARVAREEAAAAAVETILRLATGARWGLDFTLAAPAPNAQNLFSDATLRAGVALWAIDLPQPVMLWGAEAPAPPPLRSLFVGVSPDIGAAHEGDYVGPIPPETDGGDHG